MTKRFKSITEIINEDEELSELRKVTKDFRVVEEFNSIFPDLIKV